MPPWCQLLSGRIPAQGLVLRSAQSTQRTYATAVTASVPAPAVKNPLTRRRGGDLGHHLPKDVIPRDAYIPPYPYGDHQLFKQANKGLYGHKRIRFGNNVSKKTETKTRRNWKPNVLQKSLYSVALKKKIKLVLAKHILKIIDREGGLDEYLLKDSEARIKELGPMGWALRWTLMQRPEVIDRLRADAAALGLDQSTIDEQWPTPAMIAEQKAARRTVTTDVENYNPEEYVFADTEEQVMWEPREEPEKTNGLKFGKKAQSTEYKRAIIAAERYIRRGMVDSVEEGIKLAFIRAKEREEAFNANMTSFSEKLEAMDFTPEDLQDIKERLKRPKMSDLNAARLLHNERKKKELDEASGLEDRNAADTALEKERATAIAAQIAEAGGEEAYRAQRKAEYAQMIKEAEGASTNEALDPERREYLQMAMRKADIAIRAKAEASGSYAKAKAAYRRGLYEEFGDPNESSNRASRDEMLADGISWDAIVKSSNKR
ncbi:50s ribosomal protein l24 [Pyrenophora tritici-repentis]|nr:50s ribosomal protein l24 [Pyrenophora tritici-repentis]KAI0609221.1 50s ribosomal protein l24 [Pyrenophora tritici-repentis]KAI0627113.1 50s ribosomal protein l24 [Pyrenophora tritici-repentis]